MKVRFWDQAFCTLSALVVSGVSKAARFILWRQSEIDAHDIEQCFAEIWRATFGGFVAAAVFLAGLVWHRINSGEGHEGLLASEARDIANLRHELRPEGFAYGVHLHHNRILRQLRRQFVHLSAVDFY